MCSPWFINEKPYRLLPDCFHGAASLPCCCFWCACRWGQPRAAGGRAGDQGSAYLTLSFARLSSGNTGGSASSKLSAAVSDKAKASVLSTDSPSSKPAPKESPKPLSKQPQREDSQQIRRETRARPAAHQVVLKRKSQKKKARERNKSRPVVAEKRAKMAAAATVRHSAGAPAVESSGNTSENTLESPSRAGPGASVSTRAAGTGGHGSSGTGASGSGGAWSKWYGRKRARGGLGGKFLGYAAALRSFYPPRVPQTGAPPGPGGAGTAAGVHR